MPQSEVVTVGGGRRLRTTVSGPRTPVAIVLEAGIGANAATWGLVQELTSARVRTVSYDRAGYGRSDEADDRRTLADLARDLTCVVDATGAERVVLVGHSWGGPIVRTLATQDRRRVAGLVLVDASDEDAHLYYGRLSALDTRFQGVVLPIMRRTGLYLRSVCSVLAGLPEPYLTPAVASSATPEAVMTMVTEARQVVPGLLGLRATGDPLADVEMRVLSAQRATRMERGLRGQVIAAHRRRAAAAGGLFVPAHSSSHMIPVSEPALVADHALALCGI